MKINKIWISILSWELLISISFMTIVMASESAPLSSSSAQTSQRPIHRDENIINIKTLTVEIFEEFYYVPDINEIINKQISTFRGQEINKIYFTPLPCLHSLMDSVSLHGGRCHGSRGIHGVYSSLNAGNNNLISLACLIAGHKNVMMISTSELDYFLKNDFWKNQFKQCGLHSKYKAGNGYISSKGKISHLRELVKTYTLFSKITQFPLTVNYSYGIEVKKRKCLLEKKIGRLLGYKKEEINAYLATNDCEQDILY